VRDLELRGDGHGKAVTVSPQSPAEVLPSPDKFGLPDISNNVGPVKLFLNTLLSFHLKEVFSFVFFGSRYSASTTMARL
jgi:hypothetical protein